MCLCQGLSAQYALLLQLQAKQGKSILRHVIAIGIYFLSQTFLQAAYGRIVGSHLNDISRIDMV